MLPVGSWCRLLWSTAILLATTSTTDAAEQWVEARSPHFLVASDATERQARLVAHQFEQIRSLFQEVLRVRVDSGQPIVILAVRDESGLKRLLPGYWERRGAVHPSGVFIGNEDKSYVVLRLDAVGPERFDVIYHEYVHYLCDLSYSWLPVWLSEGLAEFYATTDIDEDKVLFGRMQGPHVRVLLTNHMSLRELISADRSSPYYNEASRVSVFYAEAAALTHYLLIDPQRRKGLIEYLRLLDAGSGAGEAFESALGSPEKLEKELFSYVNRMQFQAHTANVRLDEQKIETRTLGAAEAGALQGDFLTHTGRDQEARGLLEEALRQDPSLALAHEGMGLLELHGGRRREAASWFAKAVALAPHDYLALYYAGAIADPSRDPEAELLRREDDLSRAIELNPLFAPAFEALAAADREAKQELESARRYARRACSLAPARFSYRLELLRVLEAAGEKDEARGVEEEVLKRALEDPDALLRLARFYAGQGRPQDTEAVLAKAVSLGSNKFRAHLLLGEYLREEERPDDAEAEFRKALELRPRDPDILNALGYMNADRNVRVGEALSLIDQALKTAPQAAYLLDSRGWALYRLKRFDEAEKALRQAIALEPAPVGLDHLGDVLRDRGKLSEAIAVWKRARQDERAGEKLRAAIDAKLAGAGSDVAPAH